MGFGDRTRLQSTYGVSKSATSMVVNDISDIVRITSMLRLRSRIGSDKIVKLRNWRVNDATTLRWNRPNRIRLYLEFCGFHTALHC